MFILVLRKVKVRGGRDDSVIKSMYCSCGGPGFSFLHLLLTAHNCLLTPASGGSNSSGLHRLLHLCGQTLRQTQTHLEIVIKVLHCMFVSETGSYCVVLADMKLIKICLPLPLL